MSLTPPSIVPKIRQELLLKPKSVNFALSNSIHYHSVFCLWIRLSYYCWKHKILPAGISVYNILTYWPFPCGKEKYMPYTVINSGKPSEKLHMTFLISPNLSLEAFIYTPPGSRLRLRIVPSARKRYKFSVPQSYVSHTNPRC